MKFTVTQEDINRSKVLTPAWYLCRIKKVTDGVSKSSGANMTTFEFVVRDNPANPKAADGSSSADVPLKPYYLTEAGIGFGLNLLSALNGGKKVTAGAEIDSALLAGAVGKDIKIFVKNEEYQGKVGNACADFAVA
jgi:hypothetical protein